MPFLFRATCPLTIYRRPRTPTPAPASIRRGGRAPRQPAPRAAAAAAPRPSAAPAAPATAVPASVPAVVPVAARAVPASAPTVAPVAPVAAPRRRPTGPAAPRRRPAPAPAAPAAPANSGPRPALPPGFRYEGNFIMNHRRQGGANPPEGHGRSDRKPESREPRDGLRFCATCTAWVWSACFDRELNFKETATMCNHCSRRKGKTEMSLNDWLLKYEPHVLHIKKTEDTYRFS